MRFFRRLKTPVSGTIKSRRSRNSSTATSRRAHFRYTTKMTSRHSAMKVSTCLSSAATRCGVRAMPGIRTSTFFHFWRGLPCEGSPMPPRSELRPANTVRRRRNAVPACSQDFQGFRCVRKQASNSAATISDTTEPGRFSILLCCSRPKITGPSSVRRRHRAIRFSVTFSG